MTSFVNVFSSTDNFVNRNLYMMHLTQSGGGQGVSATSRAVVTPQRTLSSKLASLSAP